MAELRKGGAEDGKPKSKLAKEGFECIANVGGLVK